MDGSQHLAVIVPVFNEAENIRPFYDRAKASLQGIDGLSSWQIVFCNNGSEDESLAKLLRLREEDPHVKIITLSKNFGYQGALTAGLSSIEADLYAMIDVDCEDPPELLPIFFAYVLQGAELAYGIRSQRDEPALITLLRKIFYMLNRRLADSEIVMWMAEFSMMTRQVRNAILLPRTTYPFLRAEMAYVGFKRVGVPYQRAKRERGMSHYSLFAMTRFAIAGILSSTTFPLRFTFYSACLISIGYPLVVWLFNMSAESASRLASVLSLYFLLVTVPFVALYLARTYKNGIYRPTFIIDWHKTYLN